MKRTETILGWILELYGTRSSCRALRSASLRTAFSDALGAPRHKLRSIRQSRFLCTSVSPRIMVVRATES